MFRLVRYFSISSFIAFLAVTVLLSTLYGRIIINDLTAVAESQNVALTQAFANSLWPQFEPFVTSASTLSNEELRNAPEIKELRQAVLAQMDGLSVVKVKVYNLDGLTVFSTEEAQIGDDKSQNAGFLSAKSGQTASELTYRDTFSAFEETIENRNVFSSYIPIQPDRQNGEIVGVFEIYDDVTPLIQRIDRSQRVLVFGVGFMLILLYIVLFLIVKRADNIIKQHTTELAHANEEINVLNKRLKAENLRLGAELEVTRRVQEMILPTQEELEQIQGLDMASFVKPADEVGGDYLDVLQHNGHVKIGIGDVTGHGLESGMLMLMTQTAVRTLLTSNETDPTRFLNILNRTIYDNVQRMQANKSLSLSLLDYHPSGHMRLSGQHEELIIVRQGGQVELIDTMDLGFPIGLDDDITDFVDQALIKLEPGDGIVLYTDGITEAENIEGEQYGIERMCAALSRHWHKEADAIKQGVIDDLHQHIGQQTVFDDITLLVLKQK